MSEFTTFLGDGLADALTTMGATFTVADVTGSFNGVQGDAEIMLDPTQGGFEPDIAFTVTAKKSAFASLDVIGKKLTIDGRIGRISRVMTSANDPSVTFICIGTEK